MDRALEAILILGEARIQRCRLYEIEQSIRTDHPILQEILKARDEENRESLSDRTSVVNTPRPRPKKHALTALLDRNVFVVRSDKSSLPGIGIDLASAVEDLILNLRRDAHRGVKQAADWHSDIENITERAETELRKGD